MRLAQGRERLGYRFGGTERDKPACARGDGVIDVTAHLRAAAASVEAGRQAQDGVRTAIDRITRTHGRHRGGAVELKQGKARDARIIVGEPAANLGRAREQLAFDRVAGVR